MQFFQSIICLKGLDNRSRFSTIAFSSLFGFFLLANVFSDYFVLNVLILIVTCAMLTLSTIRRLHDAKLNSNWRYIPGVVFVVSGITILLLNNTSSFWLLLLPTLPCALLLTYPSKQRNNQYILGYLGPVDLSAFKDVHLATHNTSQRIEPILNGDTTDSSQHILETTPEAFSEGYEDGSIDNSVNQFDFGELVRIKFLQNKALQKGLLIIIVIIIISVVADKLFSKSPSNEADNQVTEDITKPLETISNTAFSSGDLQQPLNMPDNFDLYQTIHQGITVHWQADEVVNGPLWALATAKGDKSCQVIRFNKGKPIRTVSVDIENNIDYYANFSPLDSQELVKALAIRGNFSLCGYTFSLKGSQAALGKNKAYADLLD
ncbi:DUF805 domain-containing protein [Litorilituus lipolyticus]|uniref:DUF805 domain-containing protein n=1 Tax=Litorilituus lipolyticus TaxID=2491017 RepID=A0A502KQM2_9GAMM|nr:DUF805 domain-containing protein [Litorilituus lipolyticus]TPH13842.1 hypothetical protein EPA86_11965 [Litorilituus lipolyticus]